jgi:hypothetical protein
MEQNTQTLREAGFLLVENSAVELAENECKALDSQIFLSNHYHTQIPLVDSNNVLVYIYNQSKWPMAALLSGDYHR